jgi:hypothetical protein
VLNAGATFNIGSAFVSAARHGCNLVAEIVPAVLYDVGSTELKDRFSRAA